MRLCTDKGLKRPEIIETGLFVKFVFFREQDAKQDANRKISDSEEISILKTLTQKGIIQKVGQSRLTKYILLK